MHLTVYNDIRKEVSLQIFFIVQDHNYMTTAPSATKFATLKSLIYTPKIGIKLQKKNKLHEHYKL